ncbi:porin [Phenylobacterium deserti]|uniref:Porin n=1 Tax=Phenylobacterium deserti TaxID=1914756 RepID=A0A328ARB9_9CAUL|nr:porin [Phenylobacterium deserti]RAK57187.1 porin [Phenylobacterium deserti]
MRHFFRAKLAGAAAGALFSLAAPTAQAQVQAAAQAQATAPVQTIAVTPDQLLALTARLDALEQRNSELERQVQELKATAAAGDQAIRKELGGTKVAVAGGRPTLASADGKFTAAFRAGVQLDASRFSQDAPGPLAADFRRGSVGDAAEADRARDFADGANFRRARVGMEGRLFSDWDYAFLYEFGGTGTEGGGVINAAWLQYSGFGRTKIRVGAFAPPTGMDDQTSVWGALFPERSAVGEMVRGIAGADGRSSLAVLSNGDRWTLSAALTGNVVGQQSFDEQVGLVARASILPVKGSDYLVHLGVNTTQVLEPAAGGPDVAPGATRNVRLRERPENRVETVRLVDTGNIDAKRASVWGLEAAGQFKAFTVQSEYFDIGVDRRASPLPSPDFSGWYVQGAWTLTGQPRRYVAASGSFDAPRIDRPFDFRKGDWGAWELGLRVSELDLNFAEGGAGTAPRTGAIRGGDQKITTLGLNWYPNAAVRFSATYQDVQVDRLSAGGAAFGAGALTPPAGAQVGQDVQIWTLRSQYAF